MQEAPKKREAPVLTAPMARQIGFTAAYIIGLCLLFLRSETIYCIFGSNPGTHMTGFFALFVFAGIAGGFCARRERGGVFKNLGRNPSFLVIMAGVCAVQVAILYLGDSLFRTFGLSAAQLAAVLLMAATVIPFDIARKALLKPRPMRYNKSAEKPPRRLEAGD